MGQWGLLVVGGITESLMAGGWWPLVAGGWWAIAVASNWQLAIGWVHWVWRWRLAAGG
jgi:hypothetical protein